MEMCWYVRCDVGRSVSEMCEVTLRMEQRAMRRPHLRSFPLAIKSLVDAVDFKALELHFVQGHWVRCRLC